jgi:hypothetical protein
MNIIEPTLLTGVRQGTRKGSEVSWLGGPTPTRFRENTVGLEKLQNYYLTACLLGVKRASTQDGRQIGRVGVIVIIYRIERMDHVRTANNKIERAFLLHIRYLSTLRLRSLVYSRLSRYEDVDTHSFGNTYLT